MARKTESAALERSRLAMLEIAGAVKALKPRLRAIADELAAAEPLAVVVEIGDDGTTFTVERWVSEALTSSVSEALDDVLDRLAYLADFEGVRRDIHDFQ
jgi:hypothetical protein